MNKKPDLFSGFYYLVVAVLLLSQLACQPVSEAQRIIDKSIAAHGGDLYEKAKISFDFRDIYYEIHKGQDRFEYSREFQDSLGKVKDVLNNEGFQRTINGEKVQVTEERERAYSRSVNSVAYFAFLPFGLNDEAVIKDYLGEEELEGQKYHLIKVSFQQDGGGEDFEDEFLYWIHPETYFVEYLAYSYFTDGGGVRLRKAINSRNVNGIRILDYENYKPKTEPTPLDELASLYQQGQLELLSEIILRNVEVGFVTE